MKRYHGKIVKIGIFGFLFFIVLMDVYMRIEKYFDYQNCQKLMKDENLSIIYVPSAGSGIFVLEFDNKEIPKAPNVFSLSGRNVAIDSKGIGYAVDDGKIFKFDLNKNSVPVSVSWKNNLNIDKFTCDDSIAVTYDGSLIALSLDQEIVLVENNGKVLFRKFVGSIGNLSWSNNGKKIAIETKDQIHIIDVFTFNILHVSISNGYWPVWISNDEIGFWKEENDWLIWSSKNLNTQITKEYFRTRKISLMCSSVSPDGKYIIANAILLRGGFSFFVLPVSCPVVWNITTGERFTGYPIEHKAKAIFLRKIDI